MNEPESQINDLEHKEPKNSHAEKEEEKGIQKTVDSVTASGTTFERSNIHLIRVPEGGEKEQEIGNLSEKTVKENFPNSVKEIDMQVQEVQRVSIMNAKRSTPR